jgi:hypothetical protein
MVTSGSVEVHGGKFIRCTSRTLLPQAADDVDISKVSRIGVAAGALSATLAHNCQLTPDATPLFERSAFTGDAVTGEFREAALQYVREHGQSFIERFDRWLTESDPRAPRESGVRVGVGLYFFEQSRTQLGN